MPNKSEALHIALLDAKLAKLEAIQEEILVYLKVAVKTTSYGRDYYLRSWEDNSAIQKS